MTRIDEPATTKPQRRHFALFELGFRPFFLLAGVLAATTLISFVGGYATGKPLSGYYDALTWHSHEMLFGYVAAIVAGFLLTAVRNWTGMPTTTARSLAAISLLWLAARVLPYFSNTISHGVIAIVDFLFLPALIILLAVPLLRAGKKANLVFLLVLALLALANGLIHSQMLGYSSHTAITGTYLALNIIVLLIVIMAGRVVPFFIERGVDITLPRHPLLDQLAIVSVLVLASLQVFETDLHWQAVVAVTTMFIHLLRLASWHHRKLWHVPLLWVLYLAYGWLVVGFGLKTLEVYNLVSPRLSVHAFTVGGMGVMTLGMMARVALGHTGRALQVTAIMVFVFVLINLAAIARVLLPIVYAQWTTAFIVVAAIFWTLAFVIFVAVYFPVLVSPRLDGRPG